ncbi:unnamed protein product [Bursaphelenchus xylophilus]|uniref:(pine wood nematode) hypothetical protein n=1 Tax=Bursaphelenchus xylophilus TaxID=6326 RepID=A0A1I7SR74_BURXY|nr:unnamed protein product [Bursaphelenchus xylophilus]CAG9110932.1 unnamed protein product [Bursaphelenchus xylophilus]
MAVTSALFSRSGPSENPVPGQGFSISELANRLERPMEKNSLHGNALASRFESGTSSIGYLYKVTGTCLREPVDPLQRRKRVVQRQVGQNLHG